MRMRAPWFFRGLRRAYLTRLVTTYCATVVPLFARAEVVIVQVPFFTPSLQAKVRLIFFPLPVAFTEHLARAAFLPTAVADCPMRVAPAVADCPIRVAPAGSVPLVVQTVPLHVMRTLSAAGCAAGVDVGAAGCAAGAGSALTVTDTVVLAVPERSVMVTVEVAVAASVGVPLITPVTASRLSPAGRAGLTLKLAVPVRRTVGVRLVIGVPTVAVIAPGYDTDAVPKPNR